MRPASGAPSSAVRRTERIAAVPVSCSRTTPPTDPKRRSSVRALRATIGLTFGANVPEPAERLHRGQRDRRTCLLGNDIRTAGIAGVIDRAFEGFARERGRRTARTTLVDLEPAARRFTVAPQRDRIACRPQHLHAAPAAQRRSGSTGDVRAHRHKRRALIRRNGGGHHFVGCDPVRIRRPRKASQPGKSVSSHCTYKSSHESSIIGSAPPDTAKPLSAAHSVTASSGGK